ncbi:MAG: hypothetical protein M3445_01015 [Actinomycetota bacterium]|nr:hypothetical protein [Actinomycetota bacterium]
MQDLQVGVEVDRVEVVDRDRSALPRRSTDQCLLEVDADGPETVHHA